MTWRDVTMHCIAFLICWSYFIIFIFFKNNLLNNQAFIDWRWYNAVYILQYLHWPELNIRKLGCHHRKEQKSSEKHPALLHHLKSFSFRDGLDHLLYMYISELFSSFWSNSTIQIALSIYIYIGSLKWNYQIL